MDQACVENRSNQVHLDLHVQLDRECKRERETDRERKKHRILGMYVIT